MLKDIKDARQITCSDALNGRYNGNDSWKDLDSDTCNEVFELCKEFVAKTARGNRRERILNSSMDKIKNCGILGRLVYNFKHNEIEYIAGQDYIEEMKVIRGIFDWRS